MNTAEREEILAGLEPLFIRAEREKLWFHSFYQNLWFSPAELRAAHSRGTFIWSAQNWELRDPNELLIEAERRLTDARVALIAVKRRLEYGNASESAEEAREKQTDELLEMHDRESSRRANEPATE